MSAAPLRLMTLDIRQEHDVVLCRQRARQLATAFGFDLQGQTRLATAVSEIVRNAFDYAKGGKIEFAVETAHRKSATRKESAGQSLVITVRDTGPGIPPVGQRRSPGGLGLGLSGTERLVDAMEIASKPGATTVTLRKNFPPGAPVLSAPQLQAAVDRLLAEPAADPLSELQRQNQELIRALDQVNAQQADVARINQELADTNAGVLALYDELETLHRVGILLASQLDLKTLLQAIIDATTELTSAQFGAFFYREERNGGWLLHATAGSARGVLSRLPTTYDPDFFGETFGSDAAEAAVHVSSCRESKFARALGEGFILQSCLTIPVSNESSTLGALVFGSADPKAFTERSERIVASIASTAVIGIEKARLFERVQSASAAKDQFLAMVSHELRTPLNPVLAVVSNWVEDQRVPPELQEEVAIVLRNVRLEARLIDDLLDFSRIISGKLELQREPLDLHMLIRSVVEICAEDIVSGAQVVTLELDSPRAMVFGDSARLQQVLWNVLKNAVKFTPPRGRILIKTRLEDEGTIDVEVADDGVGIEAATLTHIFNAFEQGGLHTTTQFGGLGLGLAITKAFVELHGGSVRAASAGSGAGTQIHVRLPLLTQEGVVAVPVSGQVVTPESEVNAATILLVDDHVDTLNIMSRLLARRGYRVLTAGSCLAAIKTAQEHSFDLIVSDLGLPDGSGLTLLPSLRQIHDVPAVALSGYGMEEDVTKSRAVGFDEHLTKPIDFPLLMRSVNRLLSLHLNPKESAVDGSPLANR